SSHRPTALRALPSFPTRRSSDLRPEPGYRTTMTRPGRGSPHPDLEAALAPLTPAVVRDLSWFGGALPMRAHAYLTVPRLPDELIDRKSTRLNSSHVKISYAVFCL